MTGVSIEVRVDTGPAAEALARLADAVDDATPIMRALGVGLRENVFQRFEREVGPDGRAWAALSPDYAREKRGPGKLREAGIRGGLMGSITFSASRRSLELGTNKVYGLIHQVGGIIAPKNGPRLVFTMGGRPVFARSVTIPARPYLGIGPGDEETILDVVTGALDRAAGRT